MINYFKHRRNNSYKEVDIQMFHNKLTISIVDFKMIRMWLTRSYGHKTCKS